MRTRTVRKILFLICRLILGGVFVYAGLEKIIEPAGFAELIFNYQILPTELVNLTAIILPMLELTAGVLLIIGVFPLAASAILTGLLAAFMAALAFNLLRGLDFQCGCFTTDPNAAKAGWTTFLRDATLLVPAFLCTWFSMTEIKK